MILEVNLSTTAETEVQFGVNEDPIIDQNTPNESCTRHKNCEPYYKWI